MRATGMLWWVTSFGLALYLSAHIGLIVLYLLPTNPMSSALPIPARAYVEPLFAQFWWLFAPNPSVFDRTTYIQGSYDKPDGPRTTPWIQLTPMPPSGDRPWPPDLGRTMLLNATYRLTSEADLFGADDEARIVALDRWADPSSKPAALIVVERAGAAVLVATYPSTAFREIQVMLTVEPIPQLSERGDIHQIDARQDPVLLRPAPFPGVSSWPR